MSTSDPTLVLHPEVSAFVEQVRRHLADLDDETRDELTGGLEADLADQVADGAPLGDAAAYARELRTAAGLPERRRRRGIDTSGWPSSPSEVLDRARERFLAQATRPRVRPAWDLLVALRPAWWVARAWIALTLVDIWFGPWEPITLIPTLGLPWVGEILLVAAIAVSTLIGLGRLWPGSGPDRDGLRRTTLAVANTVAVVTVLSIGVPWPAELSGSDDWDADSAYMQGYRDAQHEGGILVDGRRVTDLFAYDAQGRPIEQVQLVDQDGQPVTIRPRDSITGEGASRTVACPALNGDVPALNVFPFARLTLRHGLCTPERAAAAQQPRHPLATLSPVTPAWPAPVDRTDPEQTDAADEGTADKGAADAERP